MDRFHVGFLKSLWLIKDYLPQVVIAGGWAPFVYYHYLIGDKSKNPIRTGDIDLAVENRLPQTAGKPLGEILTEAGLKPVYKTRSHPPVIHYEGEIEGLDVEIEFLTDLKGSREAEVIEVQTGLHAEALRYLTLLLENTIEVNIDDIPRAEAGSSLRARLPSPAAYIFNKGLVFPRRKERSKRGKDLYYVFDLLAYREGFKDQIVADLIKLGERYKPWFKTFNKNLAAAFSDPASEAVALAVQQRSVDAFIALTDSQFKQFVLSTFQEFLSSLR
jgi:hypothetical protein